MTLSPLISTVIRIIHPNDRYDSSPRPRRARAHHVHRSGDPGRRRWRQGRRVPQKDGGTRSAHVSNEKMKQSTARLVDAILGCSTL